MKTAFLVGLDFGSTTSSAMVASARMQQRSASARMELGPPEIIFKSKLAFTPFAKEQIDAQALASLLDGWFRESGVAPKSFWAGGAIITGLAAQKQNVSTIKALVRERINDALLATADDPGLESWLAFMGSCRDLSRTQPDTYFLNLDIGGGTTNLALGLEGNVLRTGCLFAGARHFQFVPGAYRIAALSNHARLLLHDLNINRTMGDNLSPAEVQAILDFYVALIEAAVQGNACLLREGPFRSHVQAPYIALPGISPTITLSGGVGELVYQHLRGRSLPGTTAFGDLGIDLALRLLRSPVLSHDLEKQIPANLGHATVYGMCLFGTSISGTTIYLPDPGLLPLKDLPILAKIGAETSQEETTRLLDLVGHSSVGGCIEITLEHPDVAKVKTLGQNLATAVREHGLPDDRTLVLFVSQNVGKSLGCYTSDWGKLPAKIIVIDELVTHNATFASLGALQDNVVPVSLYGLQ